MKTSLKTGALLAPTPVVLVSCGSLARPNLMTAAWVGTVCTHPPYLALSLRPSRLSYDLIRESGEAVVNLVSTDLVRAADFCGVRSGRDFAAYSPCESSPADISPAARRGERFPDKFAAAGLTPAPSREVACPSVAESPLCLECKLRRVLPLGEDEGGSPATHDLFLLEVISVTVEKSLIDESGKLHLERAHLAAYLHGSYVKLGASLGDFGFSVRRKRKSAPRAKGGAK